MKAKKGQALADVYLMTAKRAKNPKETRSMMTELECKRKIAERLQVEKIADETLVPILLAFMDDETIQKTTDMVEEGYVAIKNAVLKYVNRVVPHAEGDKNVRGLAKMQVDALQESWQDAQGVTWTPNIGNQHDENNQDAQRNPAQEGCTIK